MLQSGGNLATKRKNVGKTEILIKDGKCYKDGNIAKRQKILEGGNLTKIQKMLQRRKYC